MYFHTLFLLNYYFYIGDVQTKKPRRKYEAFLLFAVILN